MSCLKDVLVERCSNCTTIWLKTIFHEGIYIKNG